MHQQSTIILFNSFVASFISLFYYLNPAQKHPQKSPIIHQMLQFLSKSLF